jgi:hypothetical protein
LPTPLKPRRAKKGLHCPKAHFLYGNPHVHNSFSQQKKREEGEHIQPEPPLTNRNSSCRATAIPRRKISKEKNYSKNAHSLPEKLAMHAQKKSTKSAARVSGDLHLSAEYLASLFIGFYSNWNSTYEEKTRTKSTAALLGFWVSASLFAWRLYFLATARSQIVSVRNGTYENSNVHHGREDKTGISES